MSNAMQVFQFNQDCVRTIHRDNAPWFVGKDICDVLAIRTDTIPSILDVDEYAKCDPDTIGVQINAPHGITIISESGLYSLVLRSRKPEAKAFKKWVTSEVLPSIRQYGAYLTAQKTWEVLTSPDSMIRLAEEMKAMHERIRLQNNLLSDQEETIKELKPAAEYASRIMDSRHLIAANVIAKQLGMSAVTLNKRLREMGVQYRCNGTWVLSAKYQDRGYAKIVTHTITRSDGAPDTVKNLKWTEAGQRFLLDLMTKQEANPQ